MSADDETADGVWGFVTDAVEHDERLTEIAEAAGTWISGPSPDEDGIYGFVQEAWDDARYGNADQ